MVRLDPVDFFLLDAPVRNHRRLQILTAPQNLRMATAATGCRGCLQSVVGGHVVVASENVLPSGCKGNREPINKGQWAGIANSVKRRKREEYAWLVG